MVALTKGLFKPAVSVATRVAEAPAPITHDNSGGGSNPVLALNETDP